MAPGRWALSIVRMGAPVPVQPLGIECGDVPEALVNRNRAAMVETAWLDLVDEGWRVEESA